jgi:hypothetical protein
VGLTTEDGDFPGIPGRDNAVGDAGAIGREGGSEFDPGVVSELDGFAVGEQLDVDFAGSEEGIVAADEGEGAAVGGKSGVDGGVGKEGELLPVLAVGKRTEMDRAKEEHGGCGCECEGGTECGPGDPAFWF